MSRSKVYELNYTETSRLLEAFKEHISSKKHCGSYNLDILLKLQHNKTILYLQPTEDEIPTCDSNDLPEPLISDETEPTLQEIEEHKIYEERKLRELEAREEALNTAARKKQQIAMQRVELETRLVTGEQPKGKRHK